MKKCIKSWFTLIELSVAVTIFFVLALAVYAPYNYYWNKMRLKMSVKTTVQFLYDARNMAINWTIGTDDNLSIGVYLDNSDINKNKLNIISYPYSYPDSTHPIDLPWGIDTDIKILKTHNLQKGVQIDGINWEDNMLFFFHAITWESKYYNWSLWSLSEFDTSLDSEINIDFSYKWSISPNLISKITYFTNTNIVDY